MYKIVLILRGKNVKIQTFCILFLFQNMIKRILYESRFTNSTRRNQHRITPILQIRNQFKLADALLYFQFFKQVVEDVFVTL